jgi:hypothetical protein
MNNIKYTKNRHIGQANRILAVDTNNDAFAVNTKITSLDFFNATPPIEGVVYTSSVTGTLTIGGNVTSGTNYSFDGSSLVAFGVGGEAGAGAVASITSPTQFDTVDPVSGIVYENNTSADIILTDGSVIEQNKKYTWNPTSGWNVLEDNAIKRIKKSNIKIGLVAGQKTPQEREDELDYAFDFYSGYRRHVHYSPTSGVTDGLTETSRKLKYKQDIGNWLDADKEVIWNFEFFPYGANETTANWAALRDSISTRTGEFYIALKNFFKCLKDDGRFIKLAVVHESNISGTNSYPWCIARPDNYVGGNIDFAGYHQFFRDIYAIGEEEGAKNLFSLVQVLIPYFPTNPVTGEETTCFDWISLDTNVEVGFDPYNHGGYTDASVKTFRNLFEPIAQQLREMNKKAIVYEIGCRKDMYRIESGTASNNFTSTASNVVLTNPNINTAGRRDAVYSYTSGSSTVTINQRGAGFADFTTFSDVPPVLTTTVGGATITWNFEKYHSRAQWWVDTAHAISSDYSDLITSFGYFFEDMYSYDFNPNDEQAIKYSLSVISNPNNKQNLTFGNFNLIPIHTLEGINGNNWGSGGGIDLTQTTATALNYPPNCRNTVSREARAYTITKTNPSILSEWFNSEARVSAYFSPDLDLAHSFGAWMRLTPTSPREKEVIRVSFSDSAFGGNSNPMIITLTKQWKFVRGYFSVYWTTQSFSQILRIQLGKLPGLVGVEIRYPSIFRGENIGDLHESNTKLSQTTGLGGSVTNPTGFTYTQTNGVNDALLRHIVDKNRQCTIQGKYRFSAITGTPSGNIRVPLPIRVTEANNAILSNEIIGQLRVGTIRHQVVITPVPNQSFAEISIYSSSGVETKLQWSGTGTNIGTFDAVNPFDLTFNGVYEIR